MTRSPQGGVRGSHLRVSFVVFAGLAAALVSALLVGGARSASQASGLIAFTRADGIYVMRADGTGIRPVRRGGVAAGVYRLAWSPDGRRLAFTAQSRGGIWVVDVDGTGLRRVVAAKGSSFGVFGPPTWSPLGQKIAFAARRDGENDSDIWVVSADGSGLRRLARTPGLWEGIMDWSPAGDRVVFDEIAGYFLKIYVMKTNGSEIRRLAPKSLVQGQTFQAAAPDWSPDGRRVAFMGWRGSVLDSAGIVVMAANGGSQVWLTSDDVRDSDPVWSADGRQIAFIRGGTMGANVGRAEARSESEIYVMNADGTGVTRLTHNQLGEGSPAWQPVGAP